MSDEGCFHEYDLPEKFKDKVKARLERMDTYRIGGIWTYEFEDGMRYVYSQILNDIKRCKEIEEAYTRMKGLRFDLIHIREDLTHRQRERLRELKDKVQSSNQSMIKAVSE